MIDGITSIVNFFSKFFVNLLEFIKDIFVPSDDFFVNNVNSLSSELGQKLNVDTAILESLVSVSSYDTFSNNDLGYITFTLFNVPLVLDFTFITKVRNITMGLGNGLALIFVCWYHIKKVIWAIRGSAPIEGNGYTGGVFVSNAPSLSPPSNYYLK